VTTPDEPRIVVPAVERIKPMHKRPLPERIAAATDPRNWRTVPSSTFRWLAIEIRREYPEPVPVKRYYRSKCLAETWAKCNHRMYVVGQVKGFV
jgi:hypothetical protein